MTSPTRQRQPRPLPDLAFWLAVRHQEEQQQIANRTAAGLSLLWGALDFNRLDETTPAWLHATTLQVEQQFRESETAAFNYVQGAKWAVEPMSRELSQIKTVFPLRDFQLAMRATGPATVKAATQRGFSPPVGRAQQLSGVLAPELPRVDVDAVRSDAMALGKLTSTGAAVKHVLNGGRGQVQEQIFADARKRDTPIGWARFTEDSDTGPCYFCALLAANGGVFYSADSFKRSNDKIREFRGPTPVRRRDEKPVDASIADMIAKLDAKYGPLDGGSSRPIVRRAFIGDGLAKVHDHCQCSLRPVYREDDARDERAKFFEQQWIDLGKSLAKQGIKLSPKDKLNAFRRRYRRPPAYKANPVVNLARVRRNRDDVAAELGARSPQARWWDRQVTLLESA